MANIGTFKKVGNEFQGEIVMLTVQAKGVRIVPVDNRTNDNVPSHRVYVGRAEIGAAWSKAPARAASTTRSSSTIRASRADLRQPVRGRGRRGLQPDLVPPPQEERRVSRPPQSPAWTSGRGFLRLAFTYQLLGQRRVKSNDSVFLQCWALRAVRDRVLFGLMKGVAAARSRSGVDVRERACSPLRNNPRAMRAGPTSPSYRLMSFAPSAIDVPALTLMPKRLLVVQCTSLLLSDSRRRGRSPEQIGRLDAKATREPVDHVDAGSINAPFNCADVGTINLCAIGKLLLRQAFGLSEFSQIECKHLSYLHP